MTASGARRRIRCRRTDADGRAPKPAWRARLPWMAAVAASWPQHWRFLRCGTSAKHHLRRHRKSGPTSRRPAPGPLRSRPMDASSPSWPPAAVCFASGCDPLRRHCATAGGYRRSGGPVLVAGQPVHRVLHRHRAEATRPRWRRFANRCVRQQVHLRRGVRTTSSCMRK